MTDGKERSQHSVEKEKERLLLTATAQEVSQGNTGKNRPVDPETTTTAMKCKGAQEESVNTSSLENATAEENTLVVSKAHTTTE